ncbi:hypothetical protein M408DRAFT_330498, partial [Serendipita vermifera MAFF 305830]
VHWGFARPIRGDAKRPPKKADWLDSFVWGGGTSPSRIKSRYCCLSTKLVNGCERG